MYCEKSDRFVPSCSLSASTDSWVANGPSTARPTFPGKMLDTAKTIMLSRISVISARPMRLTRKRATESASLERAAAGCDRRPLLRRS